MSVGNGIRINMEQQHGDGFDVHFDNTQINDLLTGEAEPVGRNEGPNASRLLLRLTCFEARS